MRIITALLTPFNEDLSVDYLSLKNLLLFQNNSLSDALLLLGTTSESFTLSLKEKMKILNMAFQLYGKLKIINIEGNSINSILNQIDLYKQFNPYCFLISQPFFNKGDEEGLYDYYINIANYSPVPIMIYHVPSRSGFTLSINLLEKLFKHKNIIGIKNCHLDNKYNYNLSLINGCIYTGNDEDILNNAVLNNKGCISVLANIIPNYLTSIIDDIYDNKLNSALNKYKELIPLFNDMNKEINPRYIKSLMAHHKIIKHFIRPPFSNKKMEYSLPERIKDEYIINR